MASIFTKIINGELPGRFVWRDRTCVAFLSIHPLRPGHTLVVPRQEVEHWLDLDSPTLQHTMQVAQYIGRALQRAYQPAKVGMMLVGLDVPHVHVHLVPTNSSQDLNFANQNLSASAAELDEAADEIRSALDALGLKPRD